MMERYGIHYGDDACRHIRGLLNGERYTYRHWLF